MGVETAKEKERERERWRRAGELPETKVAATISGWISASACLAAESPRTVLFSAKTTSSASTIPRRSFPQPLLNHIHALSFFLNAIFYLFAFPSFTNPIDFPYTTFTFYLSFILLRSTFVVWDLELLMIQLTILKGRDRCGSV